MFSLISMELESSDQNENFAVGFLDLIVDLAGEGWVVRTKRKR